MDLNSTDHYFPELKKGQTPSDYVREIYRRAGIFITDSFRLRPCANKLCCNPAHFRLDITTSKTPRIRTKLINIDEISEEIDWDEFFDLGFERYLEVFNSRQDDERFMISRHELLSAYLYFGLKCKSKRDRLGFMLSTIVNNDRLMKTIATELFGITEL